MDDSLLWLILITCSAVNFCILFLWCHFPTELRKQVSPHDLWELFFSLFDFRAHTSSQFFSVSESHSVWVVCKMRSLCFSLSWSGRLPQLQSFWSKKELMELSKDYKEWLEQQTFLCPAAKAFLTLVYCGTPCEHSLMFLSKCHFPLW